MREQLVETFREGRELLRRLSDEELNWRGPSGSWSVAECLAHLNTTTKSYLPNIESAIHNATAGEPADFRPGWFERWFIGQIEPPVKRKTKAPAVFQPSSALDRRSISDDWDHVEKRLLKMMDTSARLDWKRTKVTSPAFKLLRMSLGAVYLLITAHNRRHLWQAVNKLREFSRVAASRS